MSRSATALVLFALVIVSLGAAMGFRMASDASQKERIEPLPANWPRVEVEPVQVRDLTDTVEVAGTTRGVQEATLHAESNGTVRHVHVEIGDWVREGSILVELIDEAEAAAYERALAQYERSKGEYRFAQFDYERTGRLYDEATSRDFGVTELELRRTRQRRDTARATKRASAAEVLSAQDALRRTVVRAPFTGVVSERFVDRGETVSPTTPLVRLDDLRQVKVQLAVSGHDYGLIDKEAPIERIRLATHGQPLTGRISAMSPSARADGLFPVEVTLDEAGLAEIDFDEEQLERYRVPLKTQSVFVREVHDADPFEEAASQDAPTASLLEQHRVLRGALPREFVAAGVTARVALPRTTLRGAVVVPESALGRSAADEFFVVVASRERMLVDYFGPNEEAVQETVRRVPVTPVRYVGRYAVLGQLSESQAQEIAAQDYADDGDLEPLRTRDGRTLPLAIGEWIVRGKQQELRTGDPVIVIDEHTTR